MGHPGFLGSVIYMERSLLLVTVPAQRALCEAQSQRVQSHLSNPRPQASVPA